MNYLFEKSTAEGAVPSSWELKSVSSVTSILVVDPLTWTYVATIFISNFANGLGTALGEGIANALFGAKGDSTDLKKYFDAMAEKIIHAIRDEIHRNAVRQEHANLAAAYEMFESYLRSPASRVGDLGSIESDAVRAYHQLKSLGPAALPGLLSAASLRVVVASERSRIASSNAEAASELHNAITVIERMQADIQDKVNDAEGISKSRVIGPAPIKISIKCVLPPDPPGGPTVKPMSQAAGLTDADPSSFVEYHTVDGIEFSIDGRKERVPLQNCAGRRTISAADAGRPANIARERIQAEFSQKVAAPWEALSDQASLLVAKARESLKATDTMAS